MSTLTANRYHDICMGHRVVGHEGKCRHLHGHNYRIHFYCEAPQLDDVGRVVDFSVIKTTLCEWLEMNWDHKFLAWDQDLLVRNLNSLGHPDTDTLEESIVYVPFNPTAENIAEHLVKVVAPEILKTTNVTLVKVDVSETRKCSVTFEL